MLAPGFLINIDKLLYLPYRLMIHLSSKRTISEKPDESNQKVVLIKMMGIGSITRIYKGFATQQFDLENTLLVTLVANRKLCELLRVKNVHYINGDSLFHIAMGLLKLAVKIRRMKPTYLINYERASNFLGLYQLLTTAFTKITSLSFHDDDRDYKMGRNKIFSISDKPFQELIEQTYDCYVKSDVHEKLEVEEVDIVSNKVLININASDYMPHRKFPIAGFEGVIEQLSRWDNLLTFDLVGSPEEKEYVESLKQALDAKGIVSHNRCGQWNLDKFMQNLADCALFITNDSGPMHLAATMQLPMIVIWGPTSPSHFGYHNQALISNIYSGEICSPCFVYAKSQAAKVCNGKISCMHSIQSIEIVDEAIKKLAKIPLKRMCPAHHAPFTPPTTPYEMAL